MTKVKTTDSEVALNTGLFIGLDNYHIHILYTGWVSCKPGSFLVFSNDFVCPRSPQPQKQGWGQNQGGWNRKDDEPELDEEAVTLGWCKLARTLCFTFNCFLILILSSP